MVVQSLEEPTASLEETLEFSRVTGVPVALDESVDAALRCCTAAAEQRAALRSLLPAAAAAGGVAAVIVKPAVIGGFEAASIIADWGKARGIQVLGGLSQAHSFVWFFILLSRCPDGCVCEANGGQHDILLCDLHPS